MRTSEKDLSPDQQASWHILYRTALFETDRKKLSWRIAEAEKAILARAQELFAADRDTIEEDLALDDALYALRALRTSPVFEASAA